jgi:hypothetical protein
MLSTGPFIIVVLKSIFGDSDPPEHTNQLAVEPIDVPSTDIGESSTVLIVIHLRFTPSIII